MMQKHGVTAALAMLFAFVACSGTKEPAGQPASAGETSAVGNSTGMGGTTASGGSLASGGVGAIVTGASGNPSTGGTPGTGGRTSSASGTAAVSSGSGGVGGLSEASSTGGLSAAGGSNATGGSRAAGGAAGAGGTVTQPSFCYSFDQREGALNVDYASFLSQHDLVYNTPVTVTDTTPGSDSRGNGVPFGNGRIGAMIWNPGNAITMQLTNIDAAPETQLSQGLLTLTTSPNLGDGSPKFEQRLNLYDGIVTTSYGSDRTVTVFGDPASELIGVHVHDTRPSVSKVTLDLALWGGNPPWKDLNWGINLRDKTTWQTVETSTTPDTVALSRGQADPDGYGYTLAASADGTTITTSKVDNLTLRLDIKPASDYTIWIACASRINSPNGNSKTQATSLLTKAKSAGYSSVLQANKDHWHRTWSRSFVQYANGAGDADYLTNLYYLSTYLFGGGSQGKAPFHFISGVYRWAGDFDLHWNLGYWIWNQRPFYNSFFASNRIEWAKPYLEMYQRNLAVNVQQTKAEYNLPGVVVPETMNAAGKPFLSDYTKHVFTSGLEIAFNMYDRYRYTNDMEYLKSVAYPYMKTVVEFYLAYAKKENGKYVLQPSNSHETYWNVKNPITDLGALRVALPRLIETSKLLGVDTDLRARWQDFLDNLSPLRTEAKKGYTVFAPYDPPCNHAGGEGGRRNAENPELELVWPYGLLGIGSANRTTAVDTWRARDATGTGIWTPDGVQALRLGLDKEGYEHLKKMVQNNQVYASGICDDKNGRFEANGMFLSHFNESLMQSHDGTIRVFPAVVSEVTTARFTLLATGGFLVSSEREGGQIRYVGLKSLHGKRATVANPWGSAAIQARRTSDGFIVANSSASTIEFDTAANTTYVIERPSDLCAGHSSAAISGKRNTAPKTLGARRLGL